MSEAISDNKERLQKVLAARGVASRRACEELITAGRISVNGVIVTELGCKVDPAKDELALDGSPIAAPPRLRYILLNKPAGYITSANDERGRRTVLDLLKGVEERVYPVGRLDYDTCGLLILTNDGELTNALLHPSYQVDKTYQALAEGQITERELERLRRGVRLKDGMTAPAEVRLRRRDAKGSLVELTIHEGRNRQVRRMLEAVGHPVLHLKRISFAGLQAGNLPLGSFRDLTAAEVRALQKLAYGDKKGGSK
ncbi:MAG: rRNA pseudouridine synthase [Firmicutes bacterium]|nr:rRNA pseudouridine synthase [Bacillota bacterium]MBQ6841759.1 rRNA pseudouridine synthase [Bacillota bacterium]